MNYKKFVDIVMYACQYNSLGDEALEDYIDLVYLWQFASYAKSYRKDKNSVFYSTYMSYASIAEGISHALKNKDVVLYYDRRLNTYACVSKSSISGYLDHIYEPLHPLIDCG